jgi:cytochrome b561
MSAEDWLVPLDDAFVARLWYCTVWGRRASEVYFDMWASAALHLAIGVGVCPACHARIAWRQAVEVVMQPRYGRESVEHEDGPR